MKMFVVNLCRAFADSSAVVRLASIKLSKTQLSKLIQIGGYLGRLLEPLIKVYQ